MDRVRILVVEDERKLAQVIASALQAERYDTVVAPTGEDGFFRANAEVFDLVLLVAESLFVLFDITDDVIVSADRLVVREAVTNLLGNAINYSPPDRGSLCESSSPTARPCSPSKTRAHWSERPAFRKLHTYW